jgi:hypothetical protein
MAPTIPAHHEANFCTAKANQSGASYLACDDSILTMKTMAREIERQMHGQWKHCTIYEKDLERLWPVDQKDRKTKIAQFAKKYGFRLRFYGKGLCAIFDKWPPVNGK